MRIGRRGFWQSLLAIATAALGLAALASRTSTSAGSAVELAGLLLMLYAAILAWWRLQVAARPLRLRLLRMRYAARLRLL